MIYNHRVPALVDENAESPDLNNDCFNHQVTVIVADTTGNFDIQVRTDKDATFWEELDGTINLGQDERTMVFFGYFFKIRAVPRGNVNSGYTAIFQGGVR